MRFIAYVGAWVAAAVFWALASASSSGRSPFETFPYGLLGMGFAGVMGLAVWRSTERVAWDPRGPRFYAVHGAAMVLYSGLYAASWVCPDLFTGQIAAAAASLRTSPVLMWNLLMGSWLYLVVGGLSYAIRAQRRARAEEAAAADARLLAQQAQLAALRAQVNPHFLFNALHSVAALVASDPARADQAIERLGDLLRYALGTEDEVLFAREWRFTQDYLAFEKLRLGERLRLDAEADAAALSVLVPPLILQPIVENAVRHGIADRPEGGLIDLRARMEGDRLTLRVADDGGRETRGTGEGVGLTSVRRRLAALYGDGAALDIERTPAGFTVVTMCLPLRRLDDDVDSAA